MSENDTSANTASTDTTAEDGHKAGEDNNAGGDKTLTQAEVDRIVKERVARERQRFADYDQMKAKAAELDKVQDANRTDHEKQLREAVTGAEAKIRADLQPRIDRLEVALTKGLGGDLAAKVLSAAKRLVGTNREELEADADEFFATAPIGQHAAGDAPAKPTSFEQGTRRPLAHTGKGREQGTQMLHRRFPELAKQQN